MQWRTTHYPTVADRKLVICFNWVSDYWLFGQTLILAAIYSSRTFMLMAIASRVMHQCAASIGTEKLNSCFLWQVGIWLLHVVHLLLQQRKSCGSVRAGMITFRWARVWWLDFLMHLLVLASLASIHFGKGLVLMDITSSVMRSGVGWIDLKNMWKICNLLVKIQEVGS